MRIFGSASKAGCYVLSVVGEEGGGQGFKAAADSA